MDISVTTTPATDQSADVLVLGLPKDSASLPRAMRPVDELVGGHISRDLEDGTLKGELGEQTWYRAPADSGIDHVLVVGAGETGAAQAKDLRRAVYGAVQAAMGKQAASVALQLMGKGRRPGPAAAAGLMAEAAVLATFDAKNWASRAEDDTSAPPESLVICDVPAKEAAAARKAVKRGDIIGEAANLTRFMVNEPANAMTPRDMAKIARAVGKEYGLHVQVLSRAQCEKLGMGSFLSVAQGSAQEPQFIVMTYEGRKKSTRLALVGKGVTFDTGGISLKPSKGMEEMKGDMAGAATVIGTMQAVAQLKPAAGVIGICPCTENMPGGRATKPGDIFTAMNGKTIEVLNTDAEGRLALADALCYAVDKGKATQIVDLATLTGACIIALGHHYTGVMTNDDKWGGQVFAAAADAGENFWQLPLDDLYAKALESKIADLANVAMQGGAGTITAAKFLQNFVGDTPWVHLDIAGTSWVNDPPPGMPKGASGVAVRTLVSLAEAL